ncbi:unnamed protein product [Closterium sp. Naga37s-1]|nr:unnamed protein product [Closterium sp. Naga37s-1]
MLDLTEVLSCMSIQRQAKISFASIKNQLVEQEVGENQLALRLRVVGESIQGAVSRIQLPALPAFKLPFFDDDPVGAITAINHVYAGTMARTLSQVVCHPIDTVKTRMQVKDPTKKLRKWRRKVVKKAFEVGPIDIDNWLIKGPSDLFRGVWGAILGTIPNAMLYFIAYEATKKKLEKRLPPGPVHVASATVGTVAASIVRVPADTLKHRVQAYLHRDVFEALKVVLQTEGVAGLYRGFWPTLMRDVPEIAIQFAVYENLRAFVKEKRKVEKLTTPEHLLLGAVAGAAAATCTMPLDLVKTRQQCGVSQGIHKIVMAVMAESGPSGLLAGLGPRVFHVSMMSAVFFGLFEYCKLIVKPDRSPSDRLYLPKIWNKRRDHIWKRQFVYTE